MPRFYFHVRDHLKVEKDGESQELPNMMAAKIESRANARDLAIERLNANKEIDGRMVEIADERGVILDAVCVRDLLKER